VDDASHAAALYDALELTILPIYYQQRERFLDIMRAAIALNGSFFTAQRMLHEYAIKAYALNGQASPVSGV
jgi:starch phosphorylase